MPTLEEVKKIKADCWECRTSRTCTCGHPTMLHLGISKQLGRGSSVCDIDVCPCLEKQKVCLEHEAGREDSC